MIHVEIPGFGPLEIEHLVLDYNGTLAVDGKPVAGVREALSGLARQLAVHVLTADTFGHVKQELAGIDCTVSILGPDRQDRAKRAYVERLGPAHTVSIGNGRNDARMLAASRLGIAVILAEGASTAALGGADIVCTDILSALDMLVHPLRLTATLRT